jgi:hypothetical protein
MSRESKIELTDRLRREGRFEPFKKRREELKAGGVPAKEAWWQAAAEFPAPTASPAPAKTPAIDLSALKGKPPIPVAQSAAWVSEHLDADWITPADAPSASAWSMREWARSTPAARTEFYRIFVAKIVMPPQEKARQAEEVSQRRSQRNLDVINSLLADCSKKQSGNSAEGGMPPGC